MLKPVLKEKTCAVCRNCCVFFDSSRWEMPTVSMKNVQKIRDFLNDENAVSENDGVFKMQSVIRENKPYQSAEEYRCPALDENKGCLLPNELKPVECSMWPLRVMKENDNIFISLASSCHAVNDEFKSDILKLLENGLKEKIIKLVNNNKSIVREYDSSYSKLLDITGDLH